MDAMRPTHHLLVNTQFDSFEWLFFSTSDNTFQWRIIPNFIQPQRKTVEFEGKFKSTKVKENCSPHERERKKHTHTEIDETYSLEAKYFWFIVFYQFGVRFVKHKNFCTLL